ncbi:hypothetical protein BU26DRAFT_275208 [Trematosphaeria pertusa]|uniref:Uncharacterized protein n=1 Tax=Trematosphaeria pertusa TaxID=390896 RepID=A0A6A6ILE6_9PLEO|nr:uncharacterized protein BU26DRAFT_275208 [Trematosphaeria pertusa]KAF2251039.1 hypothetical protein BU26DRAFT_275208 [Trematosphaeria pertusa]
MVSCIPGVGTTQLPLTMDFDMGIARYNATHQLTTAHLLASGKTISWIHPAAANYCTARQRIPFDFLLPKRAILNDMAQRVRRCQLVRRPRESEEMTRTNRSNAPNGSLSPPPFMACSHTTASDGSRFTWATHMAGPGARMHGAEFRKPSIAHRNAAPYSCFPPVARTARPLVRSEPLAHVRRQYRPHGILAPSPKTTWVRVDKIAIFGTAFSRTASKLTLSSVSQSHIVGIFQGSKPLFPDQTTLFSARRTPYSERGVG